MNTVMRVFLSVLLLPVYLLSKVWPKNKNVWVFGSCDGLRVADNSYYLFKYSLQQLDGIEKYYVTKDKSFIESNNSPNVLEFYSIRTALICLKADIFILSHSIYDIPHFLSGGSKIIQLWHGVPLKKIGDDTGSCRINVFDRAIKIAKEGIYRILPFSRYNKCNYLVTPNSPEIIRIFKSAFKSSNPLILPTGLPRLDALTKHKGDLRNIRKICWLPTHRKANGRNVVKLEHFIKNKNFLEFDEFLFQNSIQLIIKPHPIDANYLHKLGCAVKIHTDIDPYPLIDQCDVLITDYSSIFIDYLKTGKPIIFAPFDHEDYIKNVSELYFDYNSATPGPKCKTWREVKKQIEKLMAGEDDYTLERRQALSDYLGDFSEPLSATTYNELTKIA